MKSFRENPEGEENQRISKQVDREIFALQMQAKYRGEYCGGCGMLKSQCDCWDAVNGIS